jgi:hypothetical protein
MEKKDTIIRLIIIIISSVVIVGSAYAGYELKGNFFKAIAFLVSTVSTIFLGHYLLKKDLNSKENDLYDIIAKSKNLKETYSIKNNNDDYIHACEKLLPKCSETIILNFSWDEWTTFSSVKDKKSKRVKQAQKVLSLSPIGFLHRFFITNNHNKSNISEISDIINSMNVSYSNNSQINNILYTDKKNYKNFRNNLINEEGKIEVLIMAKFKNRNKTRSFMMCKLSNSTNHLQKILILFDESADFHIIHMEIINLFAIGSKLSLSYNN